MEKMKQAKLKKLTKQKEKERLMKLKKDAKVHRMNLEIKERLLMEQQLHKKKNIKKKKKKAIPKKDFLEQGFEL